jgi:hypothetical protein
MRRVGDRCGQRDFGQTAREQITKQWVLGQRIVIAALVGLVIHIHGNVLVRGKHFREELDRFNRVAAYNALRPEGVEFGNQSQLQFGRGCRRRIDRDALELRPLRRELVADGEQTYRADRLCLVD